MNSQPFDIAIIGAGFSGTLLAANLLKKAAKKIRIALIEKSAIPCRGIAYSTEDPFHILNVQADQMGAYPQDPHHFYNWLLKHPHEWRHLNRSFENLEIKPNDFLSRQLYGFYLSNVLKEAIEEGLEKDANLQIIHGEAIDIERTLADTISVFLNDGNKIEANQIVLAIGVPPFKDICNEEMAHYISNIWSSQKDNFLRNPSLKGMSSDHTLAIIGTGLTMLDVISTLVEKNYPGKIIAISKQGYLPEVHSSFEKISFTAFNTQNSPTKASTLLKVLRKEWDNLMKMGIDWRAFLDSFRPLTNAVWQKLPLEEKKRVLKWLYSFWNRHRHRLPEVTYSQVQKLKNENRLLIKQGTVISIKGQGNQLALHYHSKESSSETLLVDQVINCSGPELDINKFQSPLMKNLIKRGFLKPHPVGTGLALSANGNVEGALQKDFFALGQILFGELFETTAVPELRQQCSNLADRLLRLSQG